MRFSFYSGLIAFFLTCIGSSPLQAFPEMIRHGYASCVSCHVSPAGGGILTDYGRELSRELLATWSNEEENKPLYGMVTLPESVKLGGDIRAIQTFSDTPKIREGRFFLMQADIEAAWVSENFTLVGTTGWDPGSPMTAEDDRWMSRKHYVLAPLSEGILLRAGRFHRNFGLMIPDHSAQIRRGLGWDQGTETYNAELSLIDENYNVSITAVGGRPDDDSVTTEKGLAVSAVMFFNASYKLGLSYFMGRTSTEVGKEVVGPYWVLGLTERLYWMGEVDLVRLAPQDGGIKQSSVDYMRLGYEVFKGFDAYLVQQSRQADSATSNAYGLGLQWSPRPHWILTGQWQKLQSKSTVSDSAYFTFQYYI